MSVVYFVSSYRSWRQVERLVGRLLRSNTAEVVIHHDVARTDWNSAGSLSDSRVHALFHTPNVEWASAAEAELILRSLAWIDSNLQYEWVVYISEQDYPLRPVDSIEMDLSTSEADAFLQGGPVVWGSPYPVESEGYTRYHYLFDVFPDEGPAAAELRNEVDTSCRPWLEGGVVRFPPTIARLTQGSWWLGHYVGWPFSPDIELYCGWCWGNLRRTAVRHILSFYDCRPDIWLHLSQTFSPCEAVLHTALFNNPELIVIPDSRRLERKQPIEARAGIWPRSSFPLLAQSGKDFARKFGIGSEDDGILDMIDAQLL